MSPQIQKIEEQALRLPAEDLEILVERLLRSLQDNLLPKIDPAWIEEALKRYREYKEGQVEVLSEDTLFEDIRRELGWRSFLRGFDGGAQARP